MKSFFEDLKHRRIYQTAFGYAIAAWVILQLSSIVCPALGLPDWTVKATIGLLLAGFGVALVIGWVQERRVASADGRPITRHRRLALAAASLMPATFVAVGFLLVYHPTSPKGSSLPLPSQSSEGPTISEKSIAVLPFENLSKEEENAFFAGGVQDEILTDLARIADLKVISRTSVIKYKSGAEHAVREIAKSLGVAHILEGSVQRAGGRIRVTVQLIDARNDNHLWAEHYDRDLTDVFAIQSEIAQKIVSQLKANLSSAEKAEISQQPTRDLEAYDLYLRAKELVRGIDSMSDPKAEEKLTAAVSILEQSVARDPKFTLAYCLLTEANLTLNWTVEQMTVYVTKAETALQSAIRLAPDAGETHLARARFFYYGRRDYDHALEELETAARSLPNNADVFRTSALLERRLGRWTEAIRHFLKAIDLDPRNALGRSEACRTFIMLRQYGQAIQFADRGIADFPEATLAFRLRKSQAALEQGDPKGARAALDAISPADRNTVEAFLLWFWSALYERNYAEARHAIASRTQLAHRKWLAPDTFFEGIIARSEGNMEKAKSAFLDARQGFESRLRAKPDELIYSSGLAIVNAGLGRQDEALRTSKHALELAHDPLERPGYLKDLAQVYCWLGDRNHALEQLEDLAKIPNGVTYGDLRLNPVWDSLRNNPRFEKIVASLEPK